MDPKIAYRTHTRKYVGVVLRVGRHKYFAPLSSPKARDYDASGNIRKSTLSISLTENKGGEKTLLGTIKLNDMIPVPDSEIIEYDVNAESDSSYADLIRKELLFIAKHQTLIMKRARLIYFAKKNESSNKNDKNSSWFNSILPFGDLEQYCDSFI